MFCAFSSSCHVWPYSDISIWWVLLCKVLVVLFSVVVKLHSLSLYSTSRYQISEFIYSGGLYELVCVIISVVVVVLVVVVAAAGATAVVMALVVCFLQMEWCSSPLFSETAMFTTSVLSGLFVKALNSLDMSMLVRMCINRMCNNIPTK